MQQKCVKYQQMLVDLLFCCSLWAPPWLKESEICELQCVRRDIKEKRTRKSIHKWLKKTTKQACGAFKWRICLILLCHPPPARPPACYEIRNLSYQLTASSFSAAFYVKAAKCQQEILVSGNREGNQSLLVVVYT